MWIEEQLVKGYSYLRVVENKQTLDAETGQLKRGRKILKTIGPRAMYDDGLPNYLERLRKSFRCGVPLIESLKEYVEPKDTGPPKEGGNSARSKEHVNRSTQDESTGKQEQERTGTEELITLKFRQDTEDCRAVVKNFSSKLLMPMLDELGLDELVGKNGFTQQDVDILNLLIIGRILKPESKRKTMEFNDELYDPPIPVEDFNLWRVYPTLDKITESRNDIFRIVNRHIAAGFKAQGEERDLSTILFDLSNTYFETDKQDEDIVDEDGNIIEHGLRRKGVSKEGRKDPIVQFAMLATVDGLPIKIQMFPGNVPDISTIRPVLSASQDLLPQHFVLVGDRGTCSLPNCFALVEAGKSYVISKSIAKSGREDQNWILNPDGWVSLDVGSACKSRIVTLPYTDENGVKHVMTQKQVVYWSEAYFRKGLQSHEKEVEMLTRLQDGNDTIPIAKLIPPYVKKKIKEKLINTATGKEISKKDIAAQIDQEKLERDIALLGYYMIVTNEVHKTDVEVIRIYKTLVRIEDEFRVSKSTLEVRPVYVRTPAHIEAHLIICFLALLVMRLIQHRIVAFQQEQEKTGKPEEASLWTYGMSAERIQDALNHWMVERLVGDAYRFQKETDDLSTILKAFGINLPLRIFSSGELDNIRIATPLIA